MGNNYTMASIRDLTQWCDTKHLRGSYLFLGDFDRDYLLPFKGRYGVFFLYVHQKPEDVFLGFGFQPLNTTEGPE